MKLKINRAPAVAAALSLTVIAAALIIYPERYVEACFKGFALWAECVLPSLFPFMIVSLIFIKSGAAGRVSVPLERAARKLRMPDVFAVCLIMSLCSGYPAGSRIVREFYDGGAVDESGAKKLALLCSTSSPLFIIGTVGAKCFGDKVTGAAIFAAHAFSVIAAAFVYSLRTDSPAVRPLVNLQKSENILYECFYSAIVSVCMAGGFIAFFTCAGQIASDFNLLLPLEKLLCLFLDESLSEAVCSGLIEATGGCARAASSGSFLAVPAAGFLITFGGLSILLQQLCYLSGAKVKAGFFVSVKFIQAVLCFLLLLPLALWG